MSRDLPRLYLPAEQHDFHLEHEILLSPAHSHYVNSVLRMEVGAKLRLFNGRDGEWEAEITSSKKQKTFLSLTEKLRDFSALKERKLFFAPLKRDPTELIYRMGTELGVTHFHPIITERTNTHRLNLQRLALITQEASEQCERLDIPKIFEPVTLKNFLASYQEEKNIAVAIERSEERKVICRKADWKEKEISSLFIGPEGGFSDEEVSLLTMTSFMVPFSLGKLILRADTAVIAALSQLTMMQDFAE